MSDLFQQLSAALNPLAAERDRGRFHSPRNPVMALTVEAVELQECVQWLNEALARALDETHRAAVRGETGDVQLYLIRLTVKLG